MKVKSGYEIRINKRINQSINQVLMSVLLNVKGSFNFKPLKCV